MEFTLLWAALTGATALWIGTKIWDEGSPDDAFDRLVAATLVGLIVGRLAAMLVQGVNPITHPLEFIVVRGGVSTPAAAIGSVGWLAWRSRHEIAKLDALAPAALFGLAGWHAGCLWRSACLGTASSLPWAWSSETSDITRHPVELYAGLFLVVAAFAVARLGRRVLLRTGVALALAGLARLATEPMRPSLTGGPVEWYGLSIALGLGVAIWGAHIARTLEGHAPT